MLEVSYLAMLVIFALLSTNLMSVAFVSLPDGDLEESMKTEMKYWTDLWLVLLRFWIECFIPHNSPLKVLIGLQIGFFGAGENEWDPPYTMMV